jgi:hypothetical protein
MRIWCAKRRATIKVGQQEDKVWRRLRFWSALPGSGVRSGALGSGSREPLNVGCRLSRREQLRFKLRFKCPTALHKSAACCAALRGLASVPHKLQNRHAPRTQLWGGPCVRAAQAAATASPLPLTLRQLLPLCRPNLHYILTVRCLLLFILYHV